MINPNFSLIFGLFRTLFVGYGLLLFLPFALFSFFVVPPPLNLPDNMEITVSRHHTMSDFLQEFKRLKVWIFVMANSFFFLNVYFYLSTLSDQMLWITGQSDLTGQAYQLNYTFGILFPFWGALINPFFGYFVLGTSQKVSSIFILFFLIHFFLCALETNNES